MAVIIKTAPKGVNYISDWMTEIPTNCVFDKGVTGCGATTLAITQPGHTILAMPYRGLVDNKVEWDQKKNGGKLLGIHGDMNREAEIAKYIRTHETIKIATTYDSFPVVCDILEGLGLSPYKDMTLFVDEWHVLFNSYNFREASKVLLRESKRFDRRTFVSATPIPREYWLVELADLPEYKLVWPDAQFPVMNSIEMPDPLDYMARLCKVHLQEVSMDNYHVFINSVEGISRIIRLAGLTPDVCRIICSQSESSKRRNQEKLPDGFGIESTQNDVKRFNFYTSTCFEGQDIYDENGRTFIVSERYKDHTKMDIRTSLPQICGRIRDSKYNLEINQFYAESPTKDVSLEEYKKVINAQFSAAEKDAEQFNSLQLSKEGRDFLFRHIEERPYLSVEDGKIVADRNLANREIVGYGIINGQFASMHNMNRALSDVGFHVTNDASVYKVDIDSSTTPTSGEKRTFKEVFEQYCQLKSGSSVFDLSFTANRIEQDKPLVKTAYDILGPEKVRQLNYNQTSIKRELTKVSHQKLDTKIFLLLNEQLPKCVAIPRTEIKQRIEGIYKMLGSNQCAKATDIKKWYQVKETTKRGDDGKMIACFAIISAKYKVAKEKK